MNKPIQLTKLGTSTSEISVLNGVYTKKHKLKSLKELNAIVDGIDIISKKLSETIEYPISFNK